MQIRAMRIRASRGMTIDDFMWQAAVLASTPWPIGKWAQNFHRKSSVCAIYNSYVHTGKTDVQNVGVYIRNIAADSELITELFQDWNKTNILGQISRVESFKVLVSISFYVQILDIKEIML